MEARLKPLTKQVETLQAELVESKQEREESDDLIADLHSLVREVQQERESIVLAAAAEREMEQKTRKDLEAKLDETREELENSIQAHAVSNQNAGVTMMTEFLYGCRAGSLKNTFFNWHLNRKQDISNQALAEAEEETEMAKAGSGMRMVRERFKQWLQDASKLAISNWRVNQLDAEGRSVESQRLLLGEQLAVAKALEASRIKDHERIKHENESLALQLKEANREKQLLLMEVENLKTVGEQLVSELVITASELTEDFNHFKGKSRKNPLDITLADIRDSLTTEELEEIKKQTPQVKLSEKHKTLAQDVLQELDEHDAVTE